MAFNMKGSSLYGKINLNRGGQANRPDGRAKSSAFQKDTDPVKKERHSDKYDRVKKETDAMTPGDQEGRLANLAKEYGGTWTTEDRSGKGGSKGTYVNEKGEILRQVAINQGQAANKNKKAGAPKKTDPKDKRSDSEKKVQSKLDNRSSTYDNTPVSNSTVDAYRKTTSDGKDVNRSVSVSGDQTTRETIHKDKQTSHDNETKWLKKSLKGAKKARKKADKKKKREAKNAKTKAKWDKYYKDNPNAFRGL